MTNNEQTLRSILKESVTVVWQQRWLLWFGFFAGALAISGFWETLLRLVARGIRATDTIALMSASIRTGVFQSDIAGVVQNFGQSPLAATLAIGVYVIGLALALTLFWIASTSQGAIMDTARKRSLRLKTNPRAAWAVGRSRAWGVLGVHILLSIATMLCVVVAGLLITATATLKVIGITVAFLGFVLFSVAALLVSLIRFYSVNALVLHGFSIRESIRAGVRLARDHWLLSIELAFLLFLIGVLCSAGSILVMALVGVPFVLLAFLAWLLGFSGTVLFIMYLWLALAAVLFCLTIAFFVAWQNTAWSLLFLRLHDDDRMLPALVRWTSRLPFFRTRL